MGNIYMYTYMYVFISDFNVYVFRSVYDFAEDKVCDFIIGAPCRFSGRLEDGSFSMKTKMKICSKSNLHWRMKKWRTRISGLLKNEDSQLPYLLKMKIVFLKALKTEDLKTPLKKCVENEDHVMCREHHYITCRFRPFCW